VHPEDLTLYEKMVEHARNGGDDFEWHYRLLMPDRSIKYMHAVARATRDQSGQLEYIAAVRDVTARRLADEALDKARSELAHVARVMSLGGFDCFDRARGQSTVVGHHHQCKHMRQNVGC
jgi:hypothetical protein